MAFNEMEDALLQIALLTVQVRHFDGLVWFVQVEDRVDIFQSKTDPFVQLR
jgi:hypothetical protein